MNSQSTTCPNCENLGYSTHGQKRWAHAEICSCRVPCENCDGYGTRVERGDGGKTWVSECNCRLVSKRVQRYNAGHLPARYHGKTVEDFQIGNDSQQAVKKWLLGFQKRGKGGDNGFLLFGGPGVGKTHLLCGILRFLIMERGLNCRYIDCFQLLSELKATFETGYGSSALMEDVCSVPILGMDELGKTRPNGWQHGVLDQIISRRYDEGLTTFITTNYSMQSKAETPAGSSRDDQHWIEQAAGASLVDRVGARINSRLYEMCVPFHLQGVDYRQNERIAQ
jgi:DNA replication protein DnaC